MKFDNDTKTTILTQISLHCPRKNLKGRQWIKDMRLPTHIKGGLKLETVDEKVEISFGGDRIGYIRYKNGSFEGVFSLTKGK